MASRNPLPFLLAAALVPAAALGGLTAVARGRADQPPPPPTTITPVLPPALDARRRIGAIYDKELDALRSSGLYLTDIPAETSPARSQYAIALALIEDGGRLDEILVDQGEADEFLESGLRPWLLEEACKTAGIALTLRMQPGYDHSYYFISTFMADHIAWHAERLK